MMIDPHTLACLHARIKAHCGLRFEGDDEIRLRQALAERATALTLDASQYLHHLEHDRDELQALVNLLTINETYFFREPEQISLITEHILPRLLAARQEGEKLRILSAGCSSGEEPYSLAMALLDRHGSEFVRANFELLGADLDSNALAQAERAQYSPFSFRGVAPGIRSRYFDPCERGWQLKTAVRQHVRFQPLNLLATGLVTGLQGCDLILLRNVSIYFDTETRRQIQQGLAGLLKSDGFLIVGSAETLANDLGVLRLVEENGQFYFIKGAPPLAASSQLPASGRPLRQATVPAASSAPTAPMPLVIPADWVRPPSSLSPAELPAAREQARALIRDKQFSQAARQLDSMLAAAPADPGSMLLKAYLQLEHKHFSTARELAEAVLARDPWSLDACMLLGLTAKWAGEDELAIKHFRQTVYIEHACWPAHYFLADLWCSQGKPLQAQRALRVVLQLLNAGGETGLRELPLELPAAQIRFMCERQLARLDEHHSEA